jgi:hypothetical protein
MKDLKFKEYLSLSGNRSPLNGTKNGIWKIKDELIILRNQKEALVLKMNHRDFVKPLTIARI